MDWLEMLQQIFNILIVPVLTAVSLFLVRFIQSKTNELKTKVNDETLQKYMDMLNKFGLPWKVDENPVLVD